MKERFSSLSPTALETYLDCPRRFYYSREPLLLPRQTDYPRLLGSEVHKHIAQLHSSTKDGRPLYYKSREAMVNAWINRWHRNVQSVIDEKRLMLPEKEATRRYLAVGIECIGKYWDANVGKSPPMEVESRYSVRLPTGKKFSGVFDQVREVSLDYIAKHRPELIENRKLKEGYDPVVIVDLKTNYLSYDVRAFRENPSLEEQVREQYKLHEGLQATSYVLLYGLAKGRAPVGFVWYHLRSGKGFFTFREEQDYLNLFDMISHVSGNIEAQSFPKHLGGRCDTCEFLVPCREDRCFIVSAPEELLGTPQQLNLIDSNLTRDPVRQLRLKIKVARMKRDVPRLTRGSPTIVLKNLPWEPETGAENRTSREFCSAHDTQKQWVSVEGSLGLWVCPQCPGD